MRRAVMGRWRSSKSRSERRPAGRWRAIQSSRRSLSWGVERDVAVGVQLADRDAEPVGGADLDDGIDGERTELAVAHPGAGQHLDDQAGEGVRIRPRRPQELGGRGVVEKAWEGLVDDGQIPGEHERPLRRVGVAPVGDPVEEAMQVDESVLDADPIQPLSRSQPVLGGEPRLEVLDVVAFEIGAAGDLRVVVSEPGAELAQVVLDVLHRRRPETQSDLVDVAARHFGDAWRDDRPPADRHRWAAPWSGVGIEATGVEQRELEPVEDGGHVPSGTR